MLLVMNGPKDSSNILENPMLEPQSNTAMIPNAVFFLLTKRIHLFSHHPETKKWIMTSLLNKESVLCDPIIIDPAAEKENLQDNKNSANRCEYFLIGQKVAGEQENGENCSRITRHRK